MSIITNRTFKLERPSWVNDPSISDEDKRLLIEELGMGGSYTAADAMELQDDCFYCGQKLKIPYIYWHGTSDKNQSKRISLHRECAYRFSKGILRDADKIKHFPS